MQIKSQGERLFDFFNTVVMIVLSLIFIYPFWYQMNLSVAPAAEANQLSLRLWPVLPLDFSAYGQIFGSASFLRSLFNSVVRTVLGTLLSVLFTFCGAYVLSKKMMPFRRQLTMLVLFTMFFSGGLIPEYLLIRDLGLMGSRWALILPPLTSAWFLLIARNFIGSLPEALEEAAVIDGAGILTVMFRIILPMSKPIVAVISLWSAVNHWNAWYDAMLYAATSKQMVLALFLRRILIDNSREDLQSLTASAAAITPETVKAAVIVVSIIPIACAYPLFQKYFIKGIQVGAVKG